MAENIKSDSNLSIASSVHSPHYQSHVLPTLKDVDVPSQPGSAPLTSLLPYDTTIKAFPSTGAQEQSQEETLPPFPPEEPVNSLPQDAQLHLTVRAN